MRTVRRLLRPVFGWLEAIIHTLFSLIYGAERNKLPPIEDPILQQPATEIALKIRTGQLTSVQVLDAFITRINKANPIINALVANRFDEARKEAHEADKLVQTLSQEELAKNKPLLGVPFTTKDCIPIKGLVHSSGLLKRQHNIAQEDAKVVALLRQAGAIPIGVTNVSELCMWWESSNKVHGRTNNPYDLTRIVGGSSGGEGCAQGAALSAFGIGSDIGGSIRMPAFFNGVFGHKPSPFVVSNHGQYPVPLNTEQNSFLGLGPITRHAQDLLPLLKVILEKDEIEYLHLDEPVDVQSIKIFYQEHNNGDFMVSPVDEDIIKLFGRLVEHLEGHKNKPVKLSLRQFSKSAPMWFGNMKAPSGPTFQDQLANLNGTINPYLELLKWLFGASEHTFIALCTAIADKTGCTYGDATHKRLVEIRDDFKKDLLEILGDDGVLIYPTHPTAAPYHNEPIIKPFNFSYTGIINILGLPATHIPMGLDRNGLPIGLQVVAKPNNDRLCLAVALELEKAFGGWVAP